jgi:hypothetical protein
LGASGPARPRPPVGSCDGAEYNAAEDERSNRADAGVAPVESVARLDEDRRRRDAPNERRVVLGLAGDARAQPSSVRRRRGSSRDRAGERPLVFGSPAGSVVALAATCRSAAPTCAVNGCSFLGSPAASALTIANGIRFGLTASVFTNDLRTAHRFARDVEAGFVWINDSARHFLGAPFGGYKDSGVGRDEDFEELLSYTQVKNLNVALA